MFLERTPQPGDSLLCFRSGLQMSLNAVIWISMKDTAVLLIHCPDRKGLVARVSGLLYEHGANILHADQHQDHDLGMFFMRVEWSLNAGGGAEAATPSSGFDLVKFSRAFTPNAE